MALKLSFQSSYTAVWCLADKEVDYTTYSAHFEVKHTCILVPSVRNSYIFSRRKEEDKKSFANKQLPLCFFSKIARQAHTVYCTVHVQH